MELNDIKGLGPAKAQKLRSAGIDSVQALARCDPDQVAAASGLTLANVKELRQRAAAFALLEDLKGVGPGTLETLSERGAESLRDLYDASAEWIEAEMKVMRRKLDAMKSNAEHLAERFATEVKTPEGRQRLARESARVARETAVKAQAGGRQALLTARKAAQDIQARTPTILRQAEVRVKEAEARLKDAAAKTEKVLRAEVEKARARTETTIQKTRQRFNKA